MTSQITPNCTRVLFHNLQCAFIIHLRFDFLAEKSPETFYRAPIFYKLIPLSAPNTPWTSFKFERDLVTEHGKLNPVFDSWKKITKKSNAVKALPENVKDDCKFIWNFVSGRFPVLLPNF